MCHFGCDLFCPGDFETTGSVGRQSWSGLSGISVVFSRPEGGAGTPCDKGFKTSILQQLEKIRLRTRIASKSRT